MSNAEGKGRDTFRLNLQCSKKLEQMMREAAEKSGLGLHEWVRSALSSASMTLNIREREEEE